MSKETKKSRAVMARKTTEVDPEKKKRLAALEEKIHQGIVAYYEIGLALSEIQKEKLYTIKECKSFGEYCQKEFNYSRAYCYRLIAFCNIRNILTDQDKDRIPEKTLRALAKYAKEGKIDEDKIRECWEQAKANAGDKFPTFDEVNNIVNEHKRIERCMENGIDPDASFYLQSIKAEISTEKFADEIIEKTKKKYQGLFNAIKEAVAKKVQFSEDDKERLKTELRRRQDAVIDNLFN